MKGSFGGYVLRCCNSECRKVDYYQSSDKNIFCSCGQIVIRKIKIDIGSYRWLFQKIHDENILEYLNKKIFKLMSKKRMIFDSIKDESEKLINKIKTIYLDTKIDEYLEDVERRESNYRNAQKEYASNQQNNLNYMKKINEEILELKNKCYDKVKEMVDNSTIETPFEEIDTSNDLLYSESDVFRSRCCKLNYHLSMSNLDIDDYQEKDKNYHKYFIFANKKTFEEIHPIDLTPEFIIEEDDEDEEYELEYDDTTIEFYFNENSDALCF
jgi:hypothetical protein